MSAIVVNDARQVLLVKRKHEPYRGMWCLSIGFAETVVKINHQGKTQQKFLSDLLIKIFEKDSEDITRRWTEDVKRSVPQLNPFLEILTQVHVRVLKTAQSVLKGDASQIDSDAFFSMGRKLKSRNVPFPAVLTALALSRRSIWIHVVRKKILVSPLEIYATLELNNRIIFLYDRINAYLCSGYLG